MNKVEINVKNLPVFSYGQPLYIIERAMFTKVNEPCPVCDDKKTITVRGYEFDCPACTSTNNHIINEVYLYDYKVVEYVINTLIIQGPDSKESVKKFTDSFGLPNISYVAFTKCGHNYCEVVKKELPNYFSLDVNPNDSWIKSKNNVNELVFTNKKRAQEAIGILKERDKAFLSKFNAEHGTKHEYPFDKEENKNV